MRKTILRRYGFKNKEQLKKYQLKIYNTRRPLDSGFSALEGRLSHIAVRLGWFRSISVAAKVIKLGGLSINGGVFRNPNVLIKRGDVLLARKRCFPRATVYAKKFCRLRKRHFFKSSYSFRLNNTIYLKTHSNSIYKYRFLRINKFRLIRLKSPKVSQKKVFRPRWRRRGCSKILKKRIKFYKFLLTILCFGFIRLKFVQLSAARLSKFCCTCFSIFTLLFFYYTLSQICLRWFNLQTFYYNAKQNILITFFLLYIGTSLFVAEALFSLSVLFNGISTTYTANKVNNKNFLYFLFSSWCFYYLKKK